MFLISAFRSYFIFLNFQSYFSLRNSTLESRNYSSRLKVLAKNVLLSENKSSRQQPPIPNFVSRMHVFPHVYTLRCSRRYFSNCTQLGNPEHVEVKVHGNINIERLRFTFTAHGKRQTSVENFSK